MALPGCYESTKESQNMTIIIICRTKNQGTREESTILKGIQYVEFVSNILDY